tara:strand:- start:7548 stop:8456 length:909 start_codon:yes stop_codon:yes gene_type:complete
MDSSQNNTINPIELLTIILNKKILISSITFLFMIFSILIALYMPNLYTSKSILAPPSEESSLTSKLGSFASIANLGGINMQSMTTSKNQEAIERIKSFQFFSKYFLPNIKLEDIFAVERWVLDENKLIYDNKLFDANKNEWVRKVKYPKKKKPSAQEAYKRYSKIISINEDKQTSFITISVDHHSPIVAKEWVDLIIYQINESMRTYDIETAKNSISYLNNEYQNTNIQSIKEAIASLLENQMQTLMLATSNEAYIFKVIDSAFIPEEKSRPNRILIVFLGTFLGALFSLTIVLFQYYKRAL